MACVFGLLCAAFGPMILYWIIHGACNGRHVCGITKVMQDSKGHYVLFYWGTTDDDWYGEDFYAWHLDAEHGKFKTYDEARKMSEKINAVILNIHKPVYKVPEQELERKDI